MQFTISGTFTILPAAISNPVSAWISTAPVSLISTGDSKGIELARGVIMAKAVAPMQVAVYDRLGIPGTNTTNSESVGGGLLAPSRMANMTAAINRAIARGDTPVVALRVGTNDVNQSIPNATIMANVTSFHDQIVALGAKMILADVEPWAPSAGQVVANSVRKSLNTLYQAFAAARPATCRYIASYDAVNDTNVAGDAPAGGTAGAAGALTVDGVHASNFGMYQPRQATWRPTFQSAFPAAASQLATYTDSTLNYVNGAGSAQQGRWTGMRAYSGSDTTANFTRGTGTPADGLAFLQASGGGGLTLNWAVEAPASFGGVPTVSMSISGTPTENWEMRFLIYPRCPAGNVTTDFIMDMAFENFTGLVGFNQTIENNFTADANQQSANNWRVDDPGGALACDVLPVLNGRHQMSSRQKGTFSTANFIAYQTFSGRSGVPVSGKVQLYGALFKVV